jgi:hypothetical protein
MEKKMFTLIALTTLSILTLWVMTRALNAADRGENQKEPAAGRRKAGRKLAFLAAWAAALSREETQYLNADGNVDLAPPPERQPAAASYCPRCKAEYREGFDQCNNCDVALVIYDRSELEL